MTTLVPSVAAQPAQTPTPTVRQYIRYAFYKASRSWRQLTPAQREAARTDLLAALEPYAERLPVLRAYSTLGTRADADFLLWSATERLEELPGTQAAVP